MIGQSISHYTILEKLGEGGMGVVYKARDTQLDREVALKFLPSYLTSDPSEKERFNHEARAAASLTHQNIAVVYEIGEHKTLEGHATQLFIAMEYVQGETLKKMVGSDSLTVKKVLDIAIQISEGLVAAHEKGIVHRDIKCENIILTPKGQAKIMDFGLAKVKGATKLTKTGSTLGTAAYMSPEQARGEEVDHRSDIFSFGVVLYELLTGHLPFRGEHPAALMYSIVNAPPEPITRYNESITPEMERIVAKVLAKDREERYQHLDDLLADIRRERKKLEYSQAGYALSPTAPITPNCVTNVTIPLMKKRRWMFPTFGGLTLLIMAIFYVAFFHKPSLQLNPDRRFRTIEVPYSEIADVKITADGKWLAMTARDEGGTWGIFVMNMVQGGPRLVTSLGAVPGTITLSFDGSMILFLVWNYETSQIDGKLVSLNGGTPKHLYAGGFLGQFRPDGKRVGYILVGSPEAPSPSGKVEFWSIGIDGTDPRREFIDTITVGGQNIDGTATVGFSYSPDGKQIVWLRLLKDRSHHQLIVHDLESGTERVIVSGREVINEVGWIRDDKIAFISNRSGSFNLWMVSAVGGEPEQVTDVTEMLYAISWAQDGQKHVMLAMKFHTNFWIRNLGERKSRQITFTRDYKALPAFSPDGNQIAYVLGGEGVGIIPANAPSHIGLIDRVGKNRRQLSFGEENVSQPYWSPDGKHIVYGSRKPDEPVDSLRTFLIDPSQPGSERYIARGKPEGWVDSDRIQILTKNSMYVLSLSGGPVTKVYDDSTLARFIQGDRYILYQDFRQGKNPSLRWIVDASLPRDRQRLKARQLPWHSDNIRISGDGRIMYQLVGGGNIWITTLPEGTETLLRADTLGEGVMNDYVPSWNAREMIIGKNITESKIVMLENLFK